MIQVLDRKECCGCTACASICAHNAIYMRSDQMGFLYPFVNENYCVDCGLCNHVCQFKFDYKRYDNYEIPIAYVARLKDELQLRRSQSGGVFYALAEVFIRGGGTVYGADFTNHWKVAHKRATRLDELEGLRMTKYVQSDLRSVYNQIRADLQSGCRILFSGTSCQVAGLKAYIPINYHQQLTCIDIICHGVPSPQIWDDYIHYLESKYHSKLVKVCFRDKRFGWHGANESFLFEDGKEIFRRTYNHLYFSGYSLRPSCSVCKFTNIKRVGDITIGDAWGLSKNHQYEVDAKGASLVLVNSSKGKALLNDNSQALVIEDVELRDFLQPQLQRPTKLNSKSEKFEDDYIRKGFEYIGRRYSDMGCRYHIKHYIQFFKKALKRVL